MFPISLHLDSFSAQLFSYIFLKSVSPRYFSDTVFISVCANKMIIPPCIWKWVDRAPSEARNHGLLLHKLESHLIKYFKIKYFYKYWPLPTYTDKEATTKLKMHVNINTGCLKVLMKLWALINSEVEMLQTYKNIIWKVNYLYYSHTCF